MPLKSHKKNWMIPGIFILKTVPYFSRKAGWLLLMVWISFTAYSQNDTIKIDVGSTISPMPWNNLTNTDVGVINNMINSFGCQTSVGIAVVDSFAGINTAGTQAPNPGLGFPPSASEDSFFGNTELFGNGIQPTGGIELFHLDTSKIYTIIIFSSRMAGDNRETKYIISGQTTDSLYLNVANNTDSAVTTSLHPSPDSTIQVIASPGPNNNNIYGFYYLGAMMVLYEQEPPGPPALSLVSPQGGEYWQIGKEVKLLWESQNLPLAILDYSIDGGSSWTNIDTVPSCYNQFTWTVPGPASETCLIRIKSGQLSAQSTDFFEIADDTTSCTIVVLGSSTAAGAGASVPDSAWVNRYRSANYQQDTRISVINLARGGYTTYHLLPTGTIIPPGIGINIDTTRNITKALTYQPMAVVINLPSNDAAHFFTVDQQMENFGLMADTAEAYGAVPWICTTQPKNFVNPVQMQIQKDVRDSIFSAYGPQAIDFWYGLADTNDFLLPQYDAGDGTHLNDAGHYLVFTRVMEKSLDTICDPVVTTINPINIDNQGDLLIYPNPFHQTLHIEFSTVIAGEVALSLYDIRGKRLCSINQTLETPGKQQITWTPSLQKSQNPQLLLLKMVVTNADESTMVTKKVVLN
jgi:lysophospholipase L1-like esterase